MTAAFLDAMSPCPYYLPSKKTAGPTSRTISLSVHFVHCSELSWQKAYLLKPVGNLALEVRFLAGNPGHEGLSVWDVGFQTFDHDKKCSSVHYYRFVAVSIPFCQKS